MVNQQHIDLTLDELAAEVALTLEHYHLLGNIQDSRVSPVPDARTIRYYTTLGLLDRPSIEGRQARYGKRHLLQVVAVKALQARGLPLSEVQSRMYGLSDGELEALLASMAEVGPATRAQASPPAVLWNEITIAPGLKLMLQDGWSPTASLEEIEARIHAALRAISSQKSGHGGN